MRLSHTLTLLVGLLCGVFVTSPTVLNASAKHLHGLNHRFAHGPSAKVEVLRDTDGAVPAGVKNITFSNPKASRTYARLGELASLCLTPLQSSTWMVGPFLTSSSTSVRHGLAFSLSAEHRMRQERCGFIEGH